ncbi:DUF1285 domain-containing protein [Hephaestia sp. GCM10023244]|uniref:DUF1285 domain-containing protein n=1 Tax=unclassified Hephaestia TaxID=2631281 RepID=UPI00207706C5|nr:DUF1285 domain-containing protein [Hephaestia sp. MAHUQ-44]MCM8731845.1 DUF1285 domain-containing protein [Hephaestia sp. MAHUQ-44]
MPMPAPPAFAALSLDAIGAFARDRRLPPVDQWHPTHCGDSEMRIAADGTWFHQGSPIARPEMVRLFATILRREPDGSYVLVTPTEMLTIAVDDAPFVAVEMKAEGDGAQARLAFRLNTDDMITAGPDNPLRLVHGADGPRPYLHVRGGLDALIARPVFYDLAERALAGSDTPAGVWSNGAFFALDAP